MSPAIQRVYLVVWCFSPTGGMEQHVTELALALARAGVEVLVFSELPAPASNPYVRRLRASGIAVLAPSALQGLARRAQSRFYYPGLLLHALDGLAHRLAHPDDAPSPAEPNLLIRHLRRRLSECARHRPPSLVHVHGCRLGQAWAVRWVEDAGFPALYTEHVNLADWGGPIEPAAAAELGASPCLLATVSAAARESLQAALPAPRCIHVMRHIVRGPAQVTPLPHTLPARLLTVARLAHHKGLDVLLHAVALLREQNVPVQLQIAGEGPERESLRALATHLHLDGAVRFLGAVDPARICELWQQAAVGVLPSRTEALPLSLIEAMACARPVIATRVGGIPEVLHHEHSGLLVDAEDAPALARAIRRLIEDPPLAHRLAAAARLEFEAGAWSEAEVTRHTLSLYREAGESHRPRAACLRERLRETCSGIGKVCFVSHALSPYGDMERQLTGQAVALAAAGVEVALILSRPVRPFNRYASQLRRAGVRLLAPSWLATAFSPRSDGAARLARECNTHPPAAIHIHGWMFGRHHRALAFASRLAARHTIPLVCSEYAASDSAVPEGADALSAATPEARGALAATTHRPVTHIRHLSGDPPARPAGVNDASDHSARPFRVLCLVAPGQAALLSAAFGLAQRHCPGIELLPPATAAEFPERLSSCDAVLLSPSAAGAPLACAQAMAAAKTILLAGDPEGLPLHHLADAWFVPLADPAALSLALTELTRNPVLSHALAIAARRTWEGSGCREWLVASQLAALYTEASAHALENRSACAQGGRPADARR